MGDRVTVEQALEAAERVSSDLIGHRHPAFRKAARDMARFVLQEHSGDQLPEGVTAEDIEGVEQWLGRHPNWTVGRTLRALLDHAYPPAPSEPPRPPKREGWVLTGEWGDPWENGWKWCADGWDGQPNHVSSQRPFDSRGPFGRGTFRFRLLEVPAPPGPGWVVTKYEDPERNDMVWWPKTQMWQVWDFGGARDFGPVPGYPDGKRFIAEQEDRAGEAERLARSLDSKRWEDPEERSWMVKMAANALSLGATAPDPVRLESL